MSFLKITEPKKRDLIVAEFLKTKKNIQRNQLAERLGEQAQFTRQYKPITDVQKDLSQNILSEIKNLPKAIDFPRTYNEYTPAIEGADDDIEMIGPIANSYLRKFASKEDADKNFGIYNNKGKSYIGDTRIGIINDNIIVGEKEYQGTPGLWELIIMNERGKYEGRGVVIIPSDPNALLDILDLLMASKGAGNTGVGNEIVSICDELKRQNILDVNAYKN